MNTKKSTENNSEQNKDRRPDDFINDRNSNINNDDIRSTETNVENANAAGLGALGRNDEKLTDFDSNSSADSGDY